MSASYGGLLTNGQAVEKSAQHALLGSIDRRIQQIEDLQTQRGAHCVQQHYGSISLTRLQLGQVPFGDLGIGCTQFTSHAPLLPGLTDPPTQLPQKIAIGVLARDGFLPARGRSGGAAPLRGGMWGFWPRGKLYLTYRVHETLTALHRGPLHVMQDRGLRVPAP